MRKLGPLLALVIALVLAMAAPAGASRATEQSGRGMNRQGGPSTHPGKGWKDPGQDQGSPANDADPDCTGNRTHSPQKTNNGACDDAAGAPDEPGGTGGFDADKDWNNGCGNDTDFEDDNNGQCRGPIQPPTPTEPTPHTPHPPTKPPPGGRGPSSTPPTVKPPTTPPPEVRPPAVTPPTPVARPETT